jgi:SPP1 family phage portal protein
LSKEEFNSGTVEDVKNRIIQYLPTVLSIHRENAAEEEYLYNYYKGIQPILKKEKIVRPEINHIVLENHAFEIVEFKKTYLYGVPIQYVQRGVEDVKQSNKEINKLNDYMGMSNKANEDRNLAEWQYICGTAYRYAEVNKEKENDEDVPFIISVPDPRRTFVVYSNEIKKKPLFCGYISFKEPQAFVADVNNNLGTEMDIDIYTDDYLFKFNGNFLEGKMGQFSLVPQQMPLPNGDTTEVGAYPLVVKGQRIIEYPLNQGRLGIIELVITILNAINQVKSNDVDDIDQFVQSLLVFINQEIEPEKYRALIEQGAVEVNTSDPQKPADVKMLVNTLSHTDTKVVTDDLYNAMLTIVGVPRLKGGVSSGGDTGSAREIGEGWTLANSRANGDEVAFKESERKALKLILDICKADKSSEIKELNASDVEPKFNRSKRDNLLVKTQGLMNLMAAQVDPQTAFEIIGLFSDSQEAYRKSLDYYGEDNLWKEDEKSTTSEQKVENITQFTSTDRRSVQNVEQSQDAVVNQQEHNLPNISRDKTKKQGNNG